MDENEFPITETPPVHPQHRCTVDPRPEIIIRYWDRLPDDSPWKRPADHDPQEEADDGG